MSISRGRYRAGRRILVSRYSLVLPSARAFLHLARAAAASLALVAGLPRQSLFLAGLVAFAFAKRILRARARALMSLRRWAAVM